MRIGIDLLRVSRFARVATHARYRTLVFTAAELADADRLGAARRLERLAGRFCAKEATAKALGRGFGQGLRWRDIEVTANGWGEPVVELRGGAREIAAAAGVESVRLSVTHQDDLVVCVATTVETTVDGGRP